MADQDRQDIKSPYEMERADSKRARRSKILILSSGVAVGATMLVGAAIAVNQEITEDQVQEQVQDQPKEEVNPVPEAKTQPPLGQETGTARPQPGPNSPPPPSLDPQGKFTPGYGEGEESEHFGSDEDHPENLYHEDDEEKHSESESGDDD